MGLALSLQGRRALVCGSSRGIGRACAIELARAGAAVTLLARDQAGLEATCALLATSHGQDHAILLADFADSSQVRAVVLEQLELGTIYHILVNNTGGPPPGLAIEATPDQFRIAFEQHLLSNHVLAQLLVPGMRRARYGRIINIVSTSAREPIPGLGVSNAIRAAVAAWAKTLSRELAPDSITVNNVLPGATDTDRLSELIRERAATSSLTQAEVRQQLVSHIPMGRLAGAEEPARAVAFLASPGASYITGVSLPVDGGRMASI
jgi:3-oxoacyl-[acyl-carrier protein] reductase